MNTIDENVFRLIFGIFWFLNMIVRGHYQRAAKNAAPVVRIHEKRARLFFWILAGVFFLMSIYIFSAWLDFAHIPLPVWIRLSCGGGTLTAYLAFFGWTHRTLGKNWSGLLEIHKDHTLITNGPYRFVRHPMYSAFFLSAIGFFLLSANWLIGGTYFAGVAIMVFDRLSSEERMMTEQFGNEYEEYIKKTGRLFPRVRV